MTQDLAELLERASRQVEPAAGPTSGAGAAWRSAARMRGRRRAVGGTVAAVLLVVGAVTALQERSGDGASDPVGPPTTAPVETFDPEAQPLWEPRDLADRPRRESVLPARLAPPRTMPSLSEAPLTRAVLAWTEQGQDIRLLDDTGDWRTVPETAGLVHGTLHDLVRPALSYDGTMLAMAGNDGITVVDVRTGDRRLVVWPGPLAKPSDTAPRLWWTPEQDGWLVGHWRTTWVVRLDGSAEKLPGGGPYGTGLSVDPAGEVLSVSWRDRTLTRWRAGERTAEIDFPHQGERYAAGHGLVAFTSGSLTPRWKGPALSGLVVADAATGELLGYAPIKDNPAYYSDNGMLSARGFLDERTVLLCVTPKDPQGWYGETTYLVAWEFATGRFTRISAGGLELQDASIAPGLVVDPS